MCNELATKVLELGYKVQGPHLDINILEPHLVSGKCLPVGKSKYQKIHIFICF